MNKAFLLPLIAALALAAGACQKQQTEAERSADVERQVQQGLDAEREDDEQQRLADRQAQLDARERALAKKENRPVATVAPIATDTPATRTADRTTTRERDDEETGSYSTFYRKLEPYGDWMETSDYGYVFQPRQATQSRDWRPYTNGHWVYTDAGWTWISDEHFGWATYHYGRWTRLRSVGWVWVPGEQWAPAWVSWRKGNDYVGWAPLPPEAHFERGTGIRNWADNYYDIGPDQYAFVPANQFGAKVSARVVIPTERNVTIINQTTNVTNITYNNSVIVDRGPSYDDLRARSSQPIERFRLERTQSFTDERPVFRGEVVALPTIDFRPAERAARPSRVVRNIAQPVVERGWTGIKDTQAVQKARAKMQSESTPPPNLPSKKFVRPNRTTVIPPRPGVTNIGTPAASIAAASTPAAAEPTPPQPAENIYSPKAADRNRREEKQKQRQQEQEQRRIERQQKPQDRRGQRPNETGAAAATVTPPPAAKVAPSARPSAAPTATATPKPTATPKATAMPKATATPQAIATPRATAAPQATAAPERGHGKNLDQTERRAQRQQQMEERRGRKSGTVEATPATTAEATVTPAAEATAASATPAAKASATPVQNARKTAAEKRQEKKDRRKARRGGAEADASPEPDASASPEPQQP